MGHVASVIEQPMGIKAIQLTGKKLTVHRDIPTRERILGFTSEGTLVYGTVELVALSELGIITTKK
jgi:hypothetical protein